MRYLPPYANLSRSGTSRFTRRIQIHFTRALRHSPAQLPRICEMSLPRTDLSETETSIADILRARRLELGLSRAELARYVAPSWQPSDIDLLESHRQLMPSWIRLRQLAEALEVSVEDLLPPQ